MCIALYLGLVLYSSIDISHFKSSERYFCVLFYTPTREVYLILLRLEILVRCDRNIMFSCLQKNIKVNFKKIKKVKLKNKKMIKYT